MRKVTKAAAVLAAAVVLGVLCALQVKNVRAAGGGLTPWSARGIANSTTALQAEKASLQAELAQTQQQSATLEQQRQSAESDLASLNSQYDTMRRQAGLTDLTGQGLVVTINPRTYNENGKKKIIRVISDQELLLLVNELNAAGAQGISINGQRLISRSAIRLAGDFVNINNIATSMPYEVRALGNPDSLETALRLYGGMYDQLSEFYDVTMEHNGKMTLPAYQGGLLDGEVAQ